MPHYDVTLGPTTGPSALPRKSILRHPAKRADVSGHVSRTRAVQQRPPERRSRDPVSDNRRGLARPRTQAVRRRVPQRLPPSLATAQGACLPGVRVQARTHRGEAVASAIWAQVSSSTSRRWDLSPRASRFLRSPSPRDPELLYRGHHHARGRRRPRNGHSPAPSRTGSRWRRRRGHPSPGSSWWH